MTTCAVHLQSLFLFPTHFKMTGHQEAVTFSLMLVTAKVSSWQIRRDTSHQVVEIR
jgi:hypothetical protein